ncbi:STAS domain-containing protein [Halomonas sp. PAMB 3232]|uniref:STAS domain-containing protein n=1 Tax=Halomonas sp. PAMB 3232 TaxID=3075221 RepID=UPI00289CE03B|nr:STAS domain-containing protein [Halomonas sp. PAMB 3232]WNL40338.1 STAS domain-containing protein [Halomonas sp. PAMB 3232]
MSQLLQHGGVTLGHSNEVLVVEGDLIMNVAARVAAAGTQWLENEATSRVAFDLSGVQVAASVAISVLLEWLRTCRERGLDVERITLSAPLMRLAVLAELDELVAHPHHALTD